MALSRKAFIESQGATCKNWTWSWSFINEDEKFIIFGAWDTNTDGNTAMIFSEDWSYRRGRNQPAYPQSREHIRLIEEEGYELYVFPMQHSDDYKDKDGIGPAKIGGFTPELHKRTLQRVGGNWYASDGILSTSIPEEVSLPGRYIEGATKTISVNVYERSKTARDKCIAHHGYKCAVCDFDFVEVYGDIGEKFIHVHHIVPLGQIKEEYELDPIKDLIPVCPNCHAMIHRPTEALTVDQLRKQISTQRN